MFKPQVHRPHLVGIIFLPNKSCIPSRSWPSFSVRPWPQPQKKYRKNIRVGYVPSNIKAVAVAEAEAEAEASGTEISTSVKATAGVTMKSPNLLGGSLLLELVSAELDPQTGSQKKPINANAYQVLPKDGPEGGPKDGPKDAIFESKFVIPGDFGEIGAVLVENEHSSEVYLQHIILDGLPNGPIRFHCGSWIEPKTDNSRKRLFFTNKLYLPSQTPEGLRNLREKELHSLRGNDEGEHMTSNRIYDYDVYNDLGDPNKPKLARPVLGGSKQYPYPRRCGTGHLQYKTDPHSKTRSKSFYVPRDENFSEVKEKSFRGKTIECGWHAAIAHLNSPTKSEFRHFSDIFKLYYEGINLSSPVNRGFWQRVWNLLLNVKEDFLKFKPPALFLKDKFSWLWDEEFSRQTLAGVNPCSIKLVTEWPLKSTLDPDVYGPPESAITTELVEREIRAFMTIDEALEQKKLFIIDYHDLLLPYVSKVRQIEGTTLYGSRALFFLTPDGTLKPLAIELTRPPIEGKPQWKQVFTPTSESTGRWLWRFAKVHFLAHDSGYHQLVSHWLRTHCVTEPYIIATNRQLSVMHPIYRLLHPHFRYTMHINAHARESLINAEGIIESSFSPGKYSVELSSVAYDQQWRFDREALPADLINRGIAVEDADAPHGLKLLIEDYPFANDGLILWDALKQWVADYVNYYYKDASMVESDPELQAWWTEIRTKGHEDKKDEPWWPNLQTPDDLIGIITTITWMVSGHHSAVNFGQYDFAGYFPNRPTIARTNMPCEEPTEEGWQRFLDNPNSELLACFPSKLQATRIMATLDLLSEHSSDEEYLGKDRKLTWDEEPVIKEAFNRFSAKLEELGRTIDDRNKDNSLKNRNGAGVVPYELLRGVPYSISI
ncbi:hypothetical protein PVL29_007147 [Vitis rotundifolia]|nr:hypothetical protein PVL29_007147 [Vitis rotundifolia]